MLEPPPLALSVADEVRTPVDWSEQPRSPVTPAWERPGADPGASVLPGAYQYSAAVAVDSPKPEYPASLVRNLSRPVSISIRAQLDSSGNVVSTQQPQTETPTEKLLANAAERAAKNWRFRPATLNGVAVPGEVTINFRFVP
jgi:TonB family protein